MKAQQVTQHWNNPDVQKAVLWSVVLGGLSSTAAAVMLYHLDPKKNLRNEALKATAIGAATTVLSVGYKIYTFEKHKNEG